jgi:hypothetical protein
MASAKRHFGWLKNLPVKQSLCWRTLPPALKGPEEITKFQLSPRRALSGVLLPGSKDSHRQPDRVFAEYHINHQSGTSDKEVQQQFFGHLEAKGGKIRSTSVGDRRGHGGGSDLPGLSYRRSGEEIVENLARRNRRVIDADTGRGTTSTSVT